MWRGFCLVHGLLAIVLGDASVEEDTCMLQVRRVQSGLKARTAEEDARFLIRGTFGPTQEELDELSTMSHREWVERQMSLPVGSHREYYRKRINHRWHEEFSPEYGYAVEPCGKRSRWISFVFDKRDEDRTIHIQGTGRILVGGLYRSDIAPGTSLGWSSMTDYSGYICHVSDGVGRDVHIGEGTSCNNKQVMQNPAIYSDGATETNFQFAHVVPGVVVVSSDPSETCALQEDSIIQQDGVFYRLDKRMSFWENTPANPVRSGYACVRRNALNAAFCRVRPTGKTLSPGLRTDVVRDSKGLWFPEAMAQGGAVSAAFATGEVNFPSGSSLWPGFPSTMTYAVRWSGYITVASAGSYTFFINSDDGSRLFVGGALVIDNGGWHGMTEREATVHLETGDVAVVLDYYQLWGTLGMVLSWRGPATNNVKQVIPSSVFSSEVNEDGGFDCEVSCGSEGEVENDPSAGHHFASRITLDYLLTDFGYDDIRHVGRVGWETGKASTWVMQALSAKDQLRQRVAWGLSQIFVVSSQDLGANHLNELWTNYYDIFVRNAFGNFLDLVREVTYSPVMGKYLTHVGSTSLEHDSRFPNENFARELMQLFTIGTQRLNVDGSYTLVNGSTVQNYQTQDILNFARVFTGFHYPGFRRNTEYQSTSWVNYYDPMSITVKEHDRIPKPDLDGRFLGDGLPHCDGLPPFSWLSAGAKYVYVGRVSAEDVLELAADSLLFHEFCDGDSSVCDVPFSLTLKETLPCTGDECGHESVLAVAVGAFNFQYVPECIYFYFDESTPDATSERSVVVQSGFCASAGGARQWDGRITLDTLDQGDTAARRAECLAKCEAFGGTGCEFISGWSWGNGCYAHTSEVTFSSGRVSHWCWTFYSNALRDAGNVGLTYVQNPAGTTCDPGTEITSFVECRRVAEALGLEIGSPSINDHTWIPRYCNHGLDRLWYNKGEHDVSSDFMTPLCKAHVAINRDGELSVGGATFSVDWGSETRPEEGDYLLSVHTSSVFDQVPSLADLTERLTVTTGPSAAVCTSSCEGEVQGYSENGAFTAFKVGDVYYRNIESRVQLVGAAQSFRNPPTYLKEFEQRGGQEAVHYEVDALLRHLVSHENTGVFVGQKLIQRMGTSTPSASHVRVVAEAFKSGSYNGKQFSKKSGDLGAAVAAVMLHPDAVQFESGVAASTQGCLREPLLKVIHMMRSMEYHDEAGDPIMFRELQDLIGQYPYQAPSVFNFYHADFELPMESMSEPELEVVEEYGAVLGPEFEIFTPFFFTNYLNVMFSIISRGVSYDCDGYYTVGLNAAEMVDGYWSRSCPQGRLTWGKASTPNETISQLDLLLTGGRLTPRTRELVLSAYTSAQDGARLQEAQRAIAMSAEFNTLGNPLPLDTPRAEVPEEEVKSSLRPYKALLYLFFDGGADTFNLLVPQNCPLYDEYVETRTDLALTPAEMNTVTTAGQNCSQFGIHSSIPILKTLYDIGEAAFITNVGSLAEPLDMKAWNHGSATTCYGLFSHSDQTNGAQTLKCQDLGRSAKGFGGRITDALSSGGSYSYSSFAFSLAGTAIFPVGFETNRKIMTGEVSGLDSYDDVQHLISNITSQHHGNVYAEAYAVKFLDAVETTEAERAVRSAELEGLATSYPTGSALVNSFRTIASVISLRNSRGSERDTFYVSYGGWDMHSDLKANMVTRLSDVNTALTPFVDELRAQSVWESTVLLSASEFARTLDSNGGGSDHAWAGNHFVIGGALHGGKVLNRYPWTLKAGSPRDLGRGRLIPEFPWESIAVPVAEWMGVEEAQKDTVFPNVNAFHTDEIIAQSVLFK